MGATFSGSVVASTNTTCSGASSSVFSSAASALPLSMCTSSRMYAFLAPPALRYATRSRRSRISSTLLRDAASTSMTSSDVPSAMATQLSHSPHGSPSSPRFVQFTAFASSRAVVVLPVPRGPENRYACPTRSSRTALRRAVLTWSCPTSSAKRWGRYFR